MHLNNYRYRSLKWRLDNEDIIDTDTSLVAVSVLLFLIRF